jgi:predicted acyltransferase
VTQSSRWAGLDALRGLAIAAMILVNNPGSWGHVYPPLLHARWHGCTPTDLVFPTFLFCAGVAIVPALDAARRRSIADSALVRRIVQRMLVLVALGMMLSAFPFVTFAADRELFAPLLGVRFPGVLQRIGICYAVAACIYLWADRRTASWVTAACLLLYWPLLALVPAPDLGKVDLSTTGQHLAGWLDRTVFGSHKWKPDYDPEGLLSTVPAVATTLLGVSAGRVLACGQGLPEKMLALFVRGAWMTAVGFAWGYLFPLNKPLWTSSYALFTAGLATTALAGFVWAFEYRPPPRWSLPLQVYGRNALLVFVGSGLLGRVLGRLWTVGPVGEEVSVKAWLVRGAMQSGLPQELVSLGWALAWVGGWYLVLRWLWRRGIVWKV